MFGKQAVLKFETETSFNFASKFRDCVHNY